MRGNSRNHAASLACDDAGFIRGIDPAAARRQFNLSIGLVALLCLATLVNAFALTRQPAPRALDHSSLQPPQIVHAQRAASPDFAGG